MDTFNETPAPDGRTGKPDPTNENARHGSEPGRARRGHGGANGRVNSTPKPPTPTAIKAAIDPLDFYTAELTDAPTLKPAADGWTQNVCCPFPDHDDIEPSFGVNAKTGAFQCFGCGAQGGSVLDFIMLRDKLTLDEARTELAQRYGIDREATATRPHHRPATASAPTPAPIADPLAPIPPDALASRPQRFRELGAPSATWTYTDADGRPLAFIHRFEITNKKGEPDKTFRPQSWTPADGWRWTDPAGLWPLYRLDLLTARPDAEVLFCEGEKSSDAGALLLPDLVATTTAHGAQSPQKTDFTHLVGRHVRTWPDHDEPGAQYARTVASLAYAAGAVSVEVLDLASLAVDPVTGEPRELPPKWDAANAVANGWTAERLAGAKWVRVANPYADSEVSEVSGVQASNGADSADTPGENEGVSGVSGQTESPVPEVSKRPAWRVFDDRLDHGGQKYRPGVWHFGTDGTGELTQAWICSPLHVDAVTFDGQDNNFGRLLRFKNTLNRWREWAMPMELLSGLGNEIRAELLAMGVEIDPGTKARNLLASYLQAKPPKRRMRCALQVGWCDGSFVLPDAVIGPQASGVIFQSGERGHDEHTQGGTLDGWREGIAARAIGNPTLSLGLCASFVGPLLDLCNAEGGGIHFVGESSTGKTAVIDAACSVWGGKNYRRSWRATANGMEGAAALFNDCLLALDEISECDPREVGAIVYALGNGRGKQRAMRSGNARSVTRWLCFVLSSGERTIATTMLEGGFRAKAGQGVRLLDIPARRTHGAWDTLHGLPSGAALSDALKLAAKTHHGRAGRSYLERLTTDGRDFAALLERFRALPEFSPADAEGQDTRAAGRFALLALAGELATEYGVTGWPEGEATQAAAVGFTAWRTLRGKGNDEQRQILERVSAFIERHGDGRFSNADDPDERRVTKDRAGWWRADPGTGERVYLFTADGMREALKGFDFNQALNVLEAAKVLPTAGADGKRAKFYRIGGRGMKLYPVLANAPGDDAQGGDHGA